MPVQSPGQEAVAAELARLPTCSIQDLRNRWRNIFKSKPPKAFGFDLLRRTIAQRLQENAFGKLSTTTQRELNQIVVLLEKSPTGRLKIPTRIKSGAMLVREWKGKTHRVMVLDEGYAYNGYTYASLTEIARDITGTHWNGPRFFGLRPSDKKSTDDIATRKRGRPPKQVDDAKSPNVKQVAHDT